MMSARLEGVGFVVFDNNAYQAVSPERLGRIRSAEAERGIQPMANLTVVQELLARVRQPIARDRGRDRAALRKLGEHCRVVREGRIEVRFLTHLEGQIFRLLTGTPHESDARGYNLFAELIRIASEAGSDGSLAEIGDDLDAIESLVSAREAEYVARLEQLSRLEGDPNSMRRNLEFAAEMARRAEVMYGQTFTAENVVQRVIDIAKISSVAFALRDGIVAEVRAKGGAFAQHANSVWDEQVVCSTSAYSAIAGKRVVLVTEETRLRVAAAQADSARLVCSLDDYESEIATG